MTSYYVITAGAITLLVSASFISNIKFGISIIKGLSTIWSWVKLLYPPKPQEPSTITHSLTRILEGGAQVIGDIDQQRSMYLQLQHACVSTASRQMLTQYEAAVVTLLPELPSGAVKAVNKYMQALRGIYDCVNGHLVSGSNSDYTSHYNKAQSKADKRKNQLLDHIRYHNKTMPALRRLFWRA